MHLVHVQQPVGSAPIECGFLDVLAQDAGALLVSAAEQAAAFVRRM